jgi:hypothetical protein
MATPPRTIFDILEQFFMKRKTPGEMLNSGILKEDPTVRNPGEGAGCLFNRNLSEVPKLNGVPTLVVQCCEYLEFKGKGQLGRLADACSFRPSPDLSTGAQAA